MPERGFGGFQDLRVSRDGLNGRGAFDDMTTGQLADQLLQAGRVVVVRPHVQVFQIQQ